LIIEMHPRPAEAMSDGYQSLTPEQFADTIGRCRTIATAIGKQM
jgi:3-deoxy-7-phosphoheptulonate synthase